MNDGRFDSGAGPLLSFAGETRRLLPAVGTLRRGGDSIALVPETVRCAACGRLLAEDEAQAVRWAGWSSGVHDLYPFCEECARRELEAELSESACTRKSV